MAYAKKTLADLKQSIADKHDSGTLPTDSATLTYWTRLINEGQAYCAGKLRFVKSTSLTTTSNTAALPTDFEMAHKAITSGGVSLYQLSEQESVEAGSGLVFWISGDHASGFTFNAGTNGTYTFYYTYHPSPLSSDSDTCIIPDPEAVALYAYAKLRMAETDPLGDADRSMNEANRRIAEMSDKLSENEGDIGFYINEPANISDTVFE